VAVINEAVRLRGERDQQLVEAISKSTAIEAVNAYAKAMKNSRRK
jgi:hypothetical protein